MVAQRPRKRTTKKSFIVCDTGCGDTGYFLKSDYDYNFMRADSTTPPIAPAITKHIDGTARLPLLMLGAPPKCGYLSLS